MLFSLEHVLARVENVTFQFSDDMIMQGKPHFGKEITMDSWSNLGLVLESRSADKKLKAVTHEKTM